MRITSGIKKLFSQYAGLKKEIYVLFIGKLVTAMGSFVWPMLTFFLTTKLGLEDGVATLLIATATTVSLPAALLGGKLADKFSRKKLIVIFDFTTVTLYVLAAILPIGYHTAVLVFFAGLFQTLESPSYDALTADFSTTEHREKAFSLSYLGFNLGFITGASISGILFEKNVSLTFLVNGISIFISTVLILLFVNMKNAVHDDPESKEDGYGEYEKPVDDSVSVINVLKTRKVVLGMMLVGCLAAMPNIVMGILLPLQLKEAMGEGGAAIYGYLNSLNGCTVIVFTPILTLLMRRITEIPKAAMGLSLFVMGNVFFAVGSPLWILFFGMFVFTLGEVVTVLGANPYQSKRIPASHRGRIGGIHTVIYSLFSSLVQYIISFSLMLSGNDYKLIWTVFIIIGAFSVCLYAFLYGSDKKRFPNLYIRK